MLIWNSTQDGTAMRDGKGGYVAYQRPAKYTKRITDAENNALARRQRRRLNRAMRGWRPFAKR